MSIMNTYTGKKFDPLQMKPEDVDLIDIAQPSVPGWRTH